MNRIEKISKALNLSIYEAKIYIALQQNGPLLIKTLSRHAEIPRTTIYTPLQKLLKRGFASKTVFGKRTYYSAIQPEYLLGFIDEQKNLLQQTILELNGLGKIQSEKNNFETTFHSGINGIKTAGLFFLHNTKEKTWYSFENLDLITEKVSFEFETFYIKERVARKIKSKMILSFSEKSFISNNFLKNDIKDLRETVLLSQNQYPFQTTVVATKGLALLINPNENPFALLIRNKHLADTFITIHKCLWGKYKA
ncbi:MAG: helix-turn-helix domain-containing protein [Candidatus Moraniibacteriota bacterium]